MRACVESWQNGYCTGRENRRAKALGGSSPSLSATEELTQRRKGAKGSYFFAPLRLCVFALNQRPGGGPPGPPGPRGGPPNGDLNNPGSPADPNRCSRDGT